MPESTAICIPPPSYRRGPDLPEYEHIKLNQNGIVKQSEVELSFEKEVIVAQKKAIRYSMVILAIMFMLLLFATNKMNR